MLFLLLAAAPFASGQEPANLLNTTYRRALELERNAQYNNAIAEFRRLFRQQPYNNAYYRGLLRNLQRTGRLDEAVEIVKQRLQVVDDALGRADLGSALFKAGQPDAAMAAWQEAVQRFPKNVGTYSQIGSAMLGNNLQQQAIDLYRKAREALHDQALFSIEIANIQAGRGNFADATREFLAYVSKNPRQLPYIQRRILQFFDDTQDEEVLHIVEKYAVQHTPPQPEILQLYGTCLKRQDRFEDAFLIAQKVEALQAREAASKSQGRELFNFAQEADRAGHHDLAKQAFSYMLEHFPQSPYVISAQIGLADAYIRNREFDRAVKVLDEIIDNGANNSFALEAHFKKADLYLHEVNQAKRAAEEYEKIFSAYPGAETKRTAAIALGEAKTRMGNFAAARDWLETALNLTDERSIDDRNEIYFQLAELTFCTKSFSAALGLLENVVPTNRELDNGDKVNDALEFAMFVELGLPDSAGALSRYADARGLMLQENWSSAIPVLDEVVSRYPQSPLAAIALLDLAASYQRLGNDSAEMQAYNRLLQDYPTSIYADAALFLLAVAQERTQQHNEAIESFEKLLADFPQSIYLEEARHRLRAMRDKPNRLLPNQ